MAAATPSARPHDTRTPLWRNAAVLKWTIQVVVLLLVVGVIWFLASEAKGNLSDKGINVSFDWLNNPANFQLAEGIDTVPATMGRALWAGIVNTLRVAGAGIVASTILGTLIGLARLSPNWLASKAASIFIETLRNIPVLVQIFLWLAILSALPELAPDQGPINGWVMVAQDGIAVPRVFYADGFYQWLLFIGIGVVVSWFVRRRLLAKQAEQGGQTHAASIGLGIVVAFALVGWFANGIFGWFGAIPHGIEDLWRQIPQAVMQLVLSVAAVGAAALWIKRFLDSRRTPAGLGKLIDDDYFRMGFSAFGALLAVIVVWVVWPGLSSWIINSGGDFWGWLGDKFGDGRGSRPLDAMRPTVSDGRFTSYGPEGLVVTETFAALFIGLTLYTSAFIAEIVRGGVLAVHKGQTEAAAALGLSRSQSLRFVILPQAFRVIMPPLGNQYLNITKNTSLGIAVAYSDIVQVGQSAYNKNNQTLAVFAIWIATFLTLSLTISAVVNYINGRLAIVER